MTENALPAEPRPEWIEAVKDALLFAPDDDGEAISWRPHFWTRETAAEFMARAAYSALRKAMETT